MSSNLIEQIGTGVIYGQKLEFLFDYAKKNHFAIPSVNAANFSMITAALETAQLCKSPVIIQISHHSSHFYAGFGLDNSDHKASVLGAISAALHIHNLSEAYKIPVVLHTDHANMEKLPWIDGLLKYGEEFYAKNKKPLFSSHMIDLSDEPIETNISLSTKYFERMSKIEMGIEVELGVNCKDGKFCGDPNDLENEFIYTQPAEVDKFYNELIKINKNFLFSVAFGNRYGVQNPGNSLLNPLALMNIQRVIENKYKTEANPISFVFHGGSGSMKLEIDESLSYGVVKFNIDTDLQWAFWNGVRKYYQANEVYLKGQIGNPEGEDKPNKDKYDPRNWLRQAQLSFKERLVNTFETLNCKNLL